MVKSTPTKRYKHGITILDFHRSNRIRNNLGNPQSCIEIYSQSLFLWVTGFSRVRIFGLDSDRQDFLTTKKTNILSYVNLLINLL